MRQWEVKMFASLERPGTLGVSCKANGVALAGVPLLRHTKRGFAPRSRSKIQWLISRAYDQDAVDVGDVMVVLGATARALNAGRGRLAKAAALSLGLPELDWDGAVRIAHADDALRKYDPNEPRDWRGRWTNEGLATPSGAMPRNVAPPRSKNPLLIDVAARPTDTTAPSTNWTSDPKDWVHLPPGRRIDELGDFLEWIANSTPGEEAEIRREVKRLYYDVGDITGGDALNRAVSDASSAGSSRLARQAILDQYEPYTREDPAEAGQALRDVASLTLLLPPELAAEIATITGETATAADVWTLGWGARGMRISEALGANLKANFPVIDRFVNGIVTSIKSIDLNARTYQNATRLLTRINRYVDEVAEFNGRDWGDERISRINISGRELNLAIPKGTGSVAQKIAIETARTRAQSLSVKLIVTPF